jgi:hypothetical protein
MKNGSIRKTIRILFLHRIFLGLLCLILLPGSCILAIEQDLEVFVNNGSFVVRGQLDHEMLLTTSDAGEAIQFAIDELSVDGGEVLIYKGIYPLDEPLHMKSKVWLQGKGRSTILQVSSSNTEGVGVICKGLKGASISDLTIRPEVNHTGIAGVVLDDCGDCQVHQILCQGFGKYGIWMRNRSFLCEISSCQLADNNLANIFCEKLTGNGRGGDFVPNLINNSTIYGGGHGIECTQTIVLNIIGCVVFQSKEYGFYLRNNSNSVLISGCRTFQIEKHALVVEDTHEANISSNIFCWHRGHGIVLELAAWTTVTGNNIIDTGVRTRDGSEMNGVVVRDSCRGVLVNGNNIFNWGDQVPMHHGITEDPSCYNNQFVANNINYFTGSAIISQGKGTIVENNVSSGPKAFVSDGKPPYPDFDTLRIEKFIRE